MNELFKSTAPTRVSTRSSTNKLVEPPCHRLSGYKSISHIGPKLWNRLPSQIKSVNSTNTFKHKLKDYYFKELNKTDKEIYTYF